MLIAVNALRVTEFPAGDVLRDKSFVFFSHGYINCGEHSAVIGAAGEWTIVVYRAAVVYQHGAMPFFVIAHQHIPFRKAGCGEYKFFGDCAECLGFVRPYMNEV